MTIDERLERLVERHEALAQTVERLALSVEEQRKISEIQRKTAELQAASIDKIITAISHDAENIRALANIAKAHEDRISRLESSDDISPTSRSNPL